MADRDDTADGKAPQPPSQPPSEPPSDWKPLLDSLAQRRAAAHAMGGVERVERRHATGRLDARQRIAALLDPGSFNEIGALVGSVARAALPAAPADALVAGSGRIDGRPVLVAAEDFTVQGGSIGPGTHAKRVRLAELAAQERCPLVMLLDGAGERITNALTRHAFAPNDLQALARLSGQVPTVCAVMGPSAGHGALTAPLSDLVVMVEGAAIFAAGPPLVKASLGETVEKEALGGTAVHVKQSGVVHNAVASEEAAFAFIRRYLGYFPASAWEHPPVLDAAEGDRVLAEILELVPADSRRPYDMHAVVDLVFDRGSALEVQPDFGASILTVLARLGGEAVAVVANQPNVKAGTIDSDAADKAAHFLDIAGAFHLPVVFLADNPGVMPGSEAERSGVLRHAARMFFAQAKLATPKLHVTLRKAFGFGSSIMAMNPFDRQTITLAFPGASLAAMPAGGGGVAAAADAEIQAQLDSAETSGPWSVADTLGYDDVIDPRELRNALLAALRTTAGRRAQAARPNRSGGIRP
jgi:acetyl-CoA carboxylase carboxyltransferase component